MALPTHRDPDDRPGADDRPVLVLLPGTGAGQACYDAVRPLLRPHVRTVGVDLPGFGGSPSRPDGDARPEALADEVAETLDAEGLSGDDAPHVVGNSLGGAVALLLAQQGRVRSAVLSSPLGWQSPAEARGARALLGGGHRLASRLEPRADRLSRSPVLRTLLTGWASARPWRTAPATHAQQLRDFAGGPGFRAALHAGAGWRPPQPVAPDVPVLLLWGTLDVVLPVVQAHRAAADLPGARTVLLPKTGHVPFADDPVRVADEVVAFVRRVEAGDVRPAAARP